MRQLNDNVDEFGCTQVVDAILAVSTKLWVDSQGSLLVVLSDERHTITLPPNEGAKLT